MLDVRKKTMLLVACAVSAPAALLHCSEQVCNGFCGSVALDSATPDAHDAATDAPSDAVEESEQ